MKKLAYTTAILAVLCVPAFADNMSNSRMQTTVPTDSMTVTDWYKQNVYDPKNNKIGEIMDVLVDRSGKVTSVIVGVGGFLGAGEKDVAVPFDAITMTENNNSKHRLVMNATKSDLQAAPGFKYDRETTAWIPDTSKKSD
jgi:sporulation protein YlmC with PRC-barrel domain